ASDVPGRSERAVVAPPEPREPAIVTVRSGTPASRQGASQTRACSHRRAASERKEERRLPCRHKQAHAGRRVRAASAMSREKTMTTTVDPDGTWLYRAGGISALLLGLGYIITIPLYVQAGAPPSGGEARLQYLAGKTTVWWAILALSVLTDFLFVPL